MPRKRYAFMPLGNMEISLNGPTITSPFLTMRLAKEVGRTIREYFGPEGAVKIVICYDQYGATEEWTLEHLSQVPLLTSVVTSPKNGQTKTTSD